MKIRSLTSRPYHSECVLIFSKLMDVTAAFLHQRAISVFPYLDHWLIKNLIRNRLITQTRFCIQTIQSLGFLPNLKKSDLFPSQKFTFIGMEFLMQQNLVRVPTDRVQNLLLTIKKFLSFKHVLARTFLSLLGKLSASADFYPSSRSQIFPSYGCQSFQMGSSFRANETIFHGCWTEDQSQLHINMLEMMAIRLALKQAVTFIHHSCIMVSTDNTTVVSYINRQGGTHSSNLCVEVWKILTWCLEHDIVIRVRHIPGKFNILADRLSR